MKRATAWHVGPLAEAAGLRSRFAERMQLLAPVTACAMATATVATRSAPAAFLSERDRAGSMAHSARHRSPPKPGVSWKRSIERPGRRMPLLAQPLSVRRRVSTAAVANAVSSNAARRCIGFAFRSECPLLAPALSASARRGELELSLAGDGAADDTGDDPCRVSAGPPSPSVNARIDHRVDSHRPCT